jgi:hypothetical protein
VRENIFRYWEIDMSNIVLELRIASNVISSPYVSSGDERITEYVNGLNSFFKYEDEFLDEGVVVYLNDNTIKDGENLNKRILECVPDWVDIISCDNNLYGAVNKGAGDIEQLRYCEDYISGYDWFIHYEPRMLLKGFDFFSAFLLNPRTLFTTHEENLLPHFCTGLYSMKVADICKYIHSIDLDDMVAQKIGIEYSLYDFIKTEKIEYDTIEKINAIWLDFFTGNEVLL